MQQVTEQLYAAFERPRPVSVEGCPCCIDKKEICTLLEAELRALTPDNLSAYAGSVFLTVGGDSDFRYFAPRIFEISANNDAWYPDPEIVLGKLKLANWNTWSNGERDALVAFIEAWFTSALSDDVSDRLDAVLCGVARAGFDLSPFFQLLLNSPSALKAYFERNSYDLYLSNRLSNAFWPEAVDAERLVVSFLRSPEVEAKIAEAG